MGIRILFAWVAMWAFVVQALPSYRPGSFLYPFSSNRDDMMTFSLFNASGTNFSTNVGVNLSANGMIIYPQHRMVVMEVFVPPRGTRFYIFEYAPQTAPWLSKANPWCTSPSDGMFDTPFFLNGHFFATSGRRVYRLTLPKEAGALCELTATNLTLPMTTFFNSNSLGQHNLVSWIDKHSVMQVSADASGNPYVALYATHSLNPRAFSSAFFLLDVDLLTGDLYVTMQNVYPLNRTAYVGAIGENQEITWRALTGGWTAAATSNTRYSVDSRYFADTDGPLLCGANFFGQNCYLLSNATDPVWSGPPLNSFGAGYGLEATYDPFCG